MDRSIDSEPKHVQKHFTLLWWAYIGNNINKVFFQGLSNSHLNGYRGAIIKGFDLYKSQNISPVSERFRYFKTH